MILAVCTAAIAAGAALPTLDGRRVDPLEDKQAKGVVLVFTRSDCPISNRYAPEIERLYERFGARGFAFWLVYVDPSQPEETIRDHVREYGYRFGALLDRKHELAALAKATITPEAAVFSRGELVYRGRIDNRYIGFGKARQSATVHDLQDTLDAIDAGRSVAPKTTQAVGCYIEDLK